MNLPAKLGTVCPNVELDVGDGMSSNKRDVSEAYSKISGWESTNDRFNYQMKTSSQ